MTFLWLATTNNPNAPDQGAFGAGWYSSGGALIINALIGDLIIINGLIDGLKPEVLIQRYVLTRKALTQSRMMKLFSHVRVMATLTMPMAWLKQPEECLKMSAPRLSLRTSRVSG